LFTALVVIHVIICILLILVVLMQSSKGDGLAGAAFGGGLGGAVFGGRGTANILSRATAILATAFMVMCLVLAFMSSQTARQAGASSTTPGESSITRQAQAERDQMMQQQQANDSNAVPPVQVTPVTPADTNK
jgi:preprotein translocase subunit SecG